MSLRRVEAQAVLGELDRFDAIVDARSPAEFAEDRLPGAVNWPTLDDAQRARVGTMYKQVSAFEARKVGAALAARNIADHVEHQAMAMPREWRPLVYCWRGGQRSGSLATVLDAIGFQVHLLDGGYRAFRRALLIDLEALPARLSFRVLCGRTGSGKSRLLEALAAAGEPVLDLEALACHRGSVLGVLPDQPQPGQKAFETAVWDRLRRFDPSRPVWVESESRTIGRLRVPEALMLRMRASPCVVVGMPSAARVQLLMEDYRHFVDDVEAFGDRLDALKELRGAATVARWREAARQGGLAEVVMELLEQHYDPVYLRSMSRNYAGFADAPVCELHDGSEASLACAVLKLQSLSAPLPGA